MLTRAQWMTWGILLASCGPASPGLDAVGIDASAPNVPDVSSGADTGLLNDDVLDAGVRARVDRSSGPVPDSRGLADDHGLTQGAIADLEPSEVQFFPPPRPPLPDPWLSPLTLTNRGDRPLWVTGSTIAQASDEFFIQPGAQEFPIRLNPGASWTLSVEYENDDFSPVDTATMSVYTSIGEQSVGVVAESPPCDPPAASIQQSPSSICVGDTVRLDIDVSTPGGWVGTATVTQYHWILDFFPDWPPPVFIPDGKRLIIIPNWDGIYAVYAEVTNSCRQSSIVLAVLLVQNCS